MEKTLYEYAIKNARSSVEMEGFKIDEDIEELCKNILDGKYSVQEYIDEYCRKNKIRQNMEKI